MIGHFWLLPEMRWATTYTSLALLSMVMYLIWSGLLIVMINNGGLAENSTKRAIIKK